MTINTLEKVLAYVVKNYSDFIGHVIVTTREVRFSTKSGSYALYPVELDSGEIRMNKTEHSTISIGA